MRQDELSELRAVLREAVAACRRSNRDLEDDLGLGHGSLQRMLDGRIDIRVHHLVEIARILQVHPMEFLELAFPDWPAHHHLTEWMRPDLRKKARKSPACRRRARSCPSWSAESFGTKWTRGKPGSPEKAGYIAEAPISSQPRPIGLAAADCIAPPLDAHLPRRFRLSLAGSASPPPPALLPRFSGASSSSRDAEGVTWRAEPSHRKGEP